MHVARGTTAALLTALVLAGCASPEETGTSPEPAPTPSTSTSTSAAPSPTPTESPTPAESSDAPSEEPVLSCVAGVTEVAGADDPDAAMDAFCTVAELVRTEVFSRAFLPDEPPVADDFAGVEPYLTDAACARWDEAVTAWVDDEKRWARDLLNRLVLHDATARVPDGYVIDPDGPYSFDTSVGTPRASSGGSGEITLLVRVTSNLVLDEQGDDSGRHSLLPVSREATYTMVRGGPSDGWYLDDWQARDTFGRVGLVAG